MVQGHDGTPFAPPRARSLTCAPRAAQELLEGCAHVPWSGDPRLALGRHCIDQDVRQLLDRNLRAEGVARKRRRDLASDGRRSRKAWRGIDGRLQAVGVSHALGARSLRSLAVKLLSGVQSLVTASGGRGCRAPPDPPSACRRPLAPPRERERCYARQRGRVAALPARAAALRKKSKKHF